jgi:hypothetical protein
LRASNYHIVAKFLLIDPDETKTQTTGQTVRNVLVMPRRLSIILSNQSKYRLKELLCRILQLCGYYDNGRRHILVTAEEGAEEDCQCGALILFNQRIFDWLDETL